MRRIDLLDRSQPSVIPTSDRALDPKPTRGTIMATAVVAAVVGSGCTGCQYGLPPSFHDAGYDDGSVWAGLPPVDAHVPDAAPADAGSHDAGIVEDTGPHDG